MKTKILFFVFAISSIHSSFALAGQKIPPGAVVPKDKEEMDEPRKRAREDDNLDGEDSVADEEGLEATIRKAIRGNNPDELRRICGDRSQLPDWATDLIDANPDRDDFPFMLLYAAVRENHAGLAQHGLIKLLVKATSPDNDIDFDEGCHSPLSFAARFGDLDAVRILVEHGRADVNFVTQNDRSAALHEAAASGNTEVAAYLLQKNANIEQEDNLGRPLHAPFVDSVAGSEDNVEVIRLLLRHGADITSRAHGITPLHLAAYCVPDPNYHFYPSHDDGYGLCISMIESFRNKGFAADEVSAARNRIFVFLLCLKRINPPLPRDVVRKIVAKDDDMSKVWITSLSRGQITGSLAYLEFMVASARYLLVSLSPLLDEIWEHIERDLGQGGRFLDEEFMTGILKELGTLFDPGNRQVLVAPLIFLTLKSRFLKFKNAERTQLQEDNAPSPGELFRNIVRDRPDLTPEQAWKEVEQILERGPDHPSPAEADGPIPMDMNNDNNVNATAPEEAPQTLPWSFLG